MSARRWRWSWPTAGTSRRTPAELVKVDYEPLPAVIDPIAACDKSAPLLHAECKTNEISVRKFAYGDTAAAFARADARVALTVDYPRLSFTPMECYVVVAEYHAHDKSYDVTANFQGPFSTHPVMAKALRVPGTKMRLRIPPDSGGSFGIKLSVFPYVVLTAIAAKITGRPVKWVEDRVEHLVAASSGPNRITEIEAAVTKEGRILALRLDQREDYGAFLRAPMPGPLYRMHGAVTGAYDIANVDVTNRIVLTNKMPASLIRGFGGPQLYLAIERLVQRIAVELGLDHLDVIRRNLIPDAKFPYRTAAGALYDSGGYASAVAKTIADGRLDWLERRRDEARAAGRLYGIGFAAVVEPGMSNMGYLSTLLSADARERAGPKNGAVSMVTVNVDPLGAVSMTADVTVQGQGHETVLSQIVADRLGLAPDDIEVSLALDTGKDPWSIAAGSYSCRFSPGTAVAAHFAAVQMRDKLAGIAAKQLNILADDIEFAGGKIRSRSNPDNALPFSRVAGTAHWSPVMLPEGMAPGLSETGVWSPPELEPPTRDDRINTSLTYGFVFDMCGVEIDPATFAVRIDRYVSMHDAGKLLNPLIADGQVHGAFVQGVAAALYEEFVYDANGSFLSGTFADYLVPTVTRDSEARNPAPGDAVAAHPARRQGPRRRQLHEHAGLHRQCRRRCARGEGHFAAAHAAPAAWAPGRRRAAASRRRRRWQSERLPEAPADGRTMRGSGFVEVAAPPAAVWRALLDPESLKAVIPGCHELRKTGENDYVADVSLGVGPVRGRFTATVGLSDLVTETSGRIGGTLTGPLGSASGSGMLRLSPAAAGTRIDYDYAVAIGGKVAAVGGRLLDGATQVIIRQFFERLGRRLAAPAASGGATAPPSRSLWRRLFGRAEAP